MEPPDVSLYAMQIRLAMVHAKYTLDNGRALHENEFENNKAILGKIAALFRERGECENKVIFIGSGGSNAVCARMREYCQKRGGIRSDCLNDGALITSLADEYSFEQIFEKFIELEARPGDLLVAISSTGESQSILRGARAAKAKGCVVVTFSGCKANNALYKLGDYNVYTPSDSLGVIEIAHQAILLCILDCIVEDAS